MLEFVHIQQIKNALKSPCYQMGNLTNVTSILWFISNVKDGNF
jgi:hypothetical protein